MSTHTISTPEELRVLLKDMWNRPLQTCGSRGRLCPFATKTVIEGRPFPTWNCILPSCEPNKPAVIPRKSHRSSHRIKRKKKLYPNLGVYHATYRRRKAKESKEAMYVKG